MVETGGSPVEKVFISASRRCGGGRDSGRVG